MMKIETTNTYWGHNGKYEKLVAALSKLVPGSGSIKDSEKNPKLELFRKAQNCYYDLYNNGLCNRAAEFYRVFGIGSLKYKMDDNFHPRMYVLVEAKMNEIILEAGVEQGMI